MKSICGGAQAAAALVRAPGGHFSPRRCSHKLNFAQQTGDARMELLDGKKWLILNIANDRSIATHIASNRIKHGANFGFVFLPMDNRAKSERRVRKAMEENGFAQTWQHPCDVGSDQTIEEFFAVAKEKLGTIDFLVHSL